MQYLGTAFSLLTFSRGGNFLKATYFYMFIGLPLFLFIFRSINLVGMANKKKEKLQAKVTKKDK